MSTEAPGQPSTPGPGGPAMFGPYRLDAKIGQGGMGEVFRAFDTSRQRTVALKRLHRGFAEDGEYQERFRRESSTAARLSSPHVIPIHDFGSIDDALYIDMRLVSGRDLAAIIADDGPLDARRAVEIVRQLGNALDAAHDDGLIHRDVKPSNVLITEQRGHDFVYLVDFGIVRSVGGDTSGSLTAAGSAIGTLAYMAPELFLGRELDRRVDVYALGCLLFEALAGRPPFVSDGPALMYAHLNTAPPELSEVAPGSPATLEPVLARAMAKDPDLRYATAGELADAAVRAVERTAPAPGAPGEHAASAQPSSQPSTQTSAPTRVPPPRGTSAPPVDPARPARRYAPGPGALAPWQPSASPGPGVPHDAPSAPRPAWPQYPPTAAGPPYTSGPLSPWPPDPPPARRGLIIAVVAASVVLLLIGVVAFALLGRGSPSTATGPPAPTGGTPAAAASGPLSVAQVFPDASGANCRPSDSGDQLTTSTGVSPAEAVLCGYPAVAPGAMVIYTRWPDAAGAQAWLGDTAALGPRLDQYQTWTAGGVAQGPLYDVQRDGTVYSTGIYEGMAYGWEIRTPTLDQSWAVWNQLRFRPRTEIGG